MEIATILQFKLLAPKYISQNKLHFTRGLHWRILLLLKFVVKNTCERMLSQINVNNQKLGR